MYNNPTPLDVNIHGKKAVKQVDNYKFAKNISSCPIGIQEYFEACLDYPILFTKDTNGNWMAVAIMSLEENKNYFINTKGEYLQKKYIPAFIRKYPFVFMTNQESSSDTLFLAVEDSFLEDLNKTNQDKALFTKDKSHTQYLSDVLSFMNIFQADLLKSSKYVKELDSMNLLTKQTFTIIKDNKEYKIEDFYSVDEAAFKKANKMNKQSVCYIISHLISLRNLKRL